MWNWFWLTVLGLRVKIQWFFPQSWTEERKYVKLGNELSSNPMLKMLNLMNVKFGCKVSNFLMQKFPVKVSN